VWEEVDIAIKARDLCKMFRRDTGEIVHALDGVSIEARLHALTH
jgi:hypothetical protein